MLSIKNVTKRFGGIVAVNDSSFHVENSTICSLIGPNGAGKSTMFNLLIGLIKPDFGKVIIENEDVTNFPIYERARKFQIGYVPQYGCYFHDLHLI